MAARPIWVVTALLVLAGGCANVQYARREDDGSKDPNRLPELAAQARPPIADLPVPLGFELDEKVSRSFAASGSRYVDHVYKGRCDKYAIARFYKRHMPICRWALVTDMFVQGSIQLEFEKEGERCRIAIVGKGTLSSSRVEAQVWSNGRISMAASP